LSGIAHHLESLISEYGIAALFVSVTLEALGAPLPGESAVILASTAAAAGKLDIYAVAAAAFLAAVLGDNIGYLLGRKLGRPVITRYGARFGLTDAAFDRVEAVARRRGPLMVVVARFVVVLRQLNGIVAGTTGMPWRIFLLANSAGAALWVALWTTLAYKFGHSTDIIPFVWHHLSAVMAIAVPLLILVLAVLHFRRRGAAPG
jgi:membrane protein DedA with SNARE-associated domain